MAGHLRPGLLVSERRDFNGFDVHGSENSGSGAVFGQIQESIEINDGSRI